MSERDNSLGAFLLGFIVGGLTGAIVSLLYAPKAGDETRQYVKERAIELRDKAGDVVEHTYVQAETVAKEGVKRAEVVLDEAKTRATDLKSSGKSLLEEQKAKLRKTAKAVEEELPEAPAEE